MQDAVPLPALRILALSLILTTSLCSYGQKRTYEPLFETIDPEDIEIVRDSFGTPHIFGPTDASVAYGLAWVNAEDNFQIMQDVIYSTAGFGGRDQGKDGAEIDFYVHAIDAEGKAAHAWNNILQDDYKKYLDGYCQGINAYALKHWDEVRIKKAFPVQPIELVSAYYVV
jgi:acyl-homoserine-lactone acylase